MSLPGSGETVLGDARAVICDVDGVVHRGSSVMPTAVETLKGLAGRGVRVVYATNNASRPPSALQQRLQEDGLTVDESQVVTSSMAGAQVLGRHVPQGASVLAVGGPGVAAAIEAAGFRAVQPADAASGERVEAVLQGYGPEVTATDLAEAAYAIQGGATWVATNEDITLPTERGFAPGNGSLVLALRGAAGVDPLVAGKPHAPLYELASAVAGAEPSGCLAVGDRLDTDIAGAVTTGMRSALVLTGVSSVEDVLRADDSERPTVVIGRLADLLEPWGTSGRGRDLADANERIRGVWAERDTGDGDRSGCARPAREHVAAVEALLLGPVAGDGASDDV